MSVILHTIFTRNTNPPIRLSTNAREWRIENEPRNCSRRDERERENKLNEVFVECRKQENFIGFTRNISIDIFLTSLNV